MIGSGSKLQPLIKVTVWGYGSRKPPVGLDMNSNRTGRKVRQPKAV